jgi:PTS system mannose-specific IIA component
MIATVLITHGLFAQELLKTAQDIVGRQESVYALAVTSETSPEDLGKNVEDILTRWGSGGVLILVDMLGGTPCNVSMMKTRQSNAEIVTGVNLYMVISAFRHREEMDLKALATKVADDGRRAIVLPKELLQKKIS